VTKPQVFSSVESVPAAVSAHTNSVVADCNKRREEALSTKGPLTRLVWAVVDAVQHEFPEAQFQLVKDWLGNTQLNVYSDASPSQIHSLTQPIIGKFPDLGLKVHPTMTRLAGV